MTHQPGAGQRAPSEAPSGDPFAPIFRDVSLVGDDQFDEAQLRSLYRVAKLVMADLNIDSTLRVIMEAAQSLIRAEMVGILLLDETGELVVRANSGVAFDMVGESVPVAETLIGRCIGSRQAILLPDLRPRLRPGQRADPDARCYIMAPLHHGSQALGLMTLATREPGALTEADLALAAAFAEQAATALANAHAYRDEEVRRAASDELVTQLALRTEELETAHGQLVTNEKLIAIGKLAAGIAHEINTPLSVVMSNLHVLERYCEQLGGLVDQVDTILRDVDTEAPDGLREAFIKSDAEYILGDLPVLAQRSIGSSQRVAEIVRSIAQFAGKGEADKFASVNLTDAIEAALTLAWNQLKSRAEIVRQIEPLPRIQGQSSALIQMFVHLLVNAALAMDKGPGFLTIEARTQDDWVVVRITDTGCGIEAEHLQSVFDPFFTTRPQGQGTGLGLAVCHGIVSSHGGTMSLESEVGSGTSVTLRFPASNAGRLPEIKAAA